MLSCRPVSKRYVQIFHVSELEYPKANNERKDVVMWIILEEEE
jgi:hypothetical protein